MRFYCYCTLLDVCADDQCSLCQQQLSAIRDKVKEGGTHHWWWSLSEATPTVEIYIKKASTTKKLFSFSQTQTHTLTKFYNQYMIVRI